MSSRFRACVDILRRGVPPSLRRMTLHLDTDSEDDDKDPIFSMEWDDLDRTLCRIPSLASFVIDVCPGWGPPPREKRNLGDVFATLLPAVREQGILEVRDRNVGDVPLYFAIQPLNSCYSSQDSMPFSEVPY
ncbi:hypothetical protein C8T65DRAFT_161715 [Cerioporus squamosus]|nr:hypothetical protein C8T65DRAFT_161715 [Cerioporus squamosus]